MEPEPRDIDFINQAVVFDPDPADCAAAAAAVREYFAAEKVNAKVVKFSDARAFIRYVSEKRQGTACFDVPIAEGRTFCFIRICPIFIGVDSMADLETARKIRELDKISPLFMMSRTDAYGSEAYRLKMLNLLLKPVTPEGVRDSVERVSREEIKYGAEERR